MMNPARSMCGCTTPSPARLPIDRTHRWAVRRSSRWPSRRHRIGPSWRSPTARSTVRAVRGTSGITAGLLPFADDREGPVSALDGEVLDVRAARFGHPQAVEAKQHSQCGVHRVVPLSGEQEGAELGAVHPVPLGLGDLGAANVLGGVGGDATVDVGEPVVATHRGQPPIDRRGRQASLLHRHSIELDVGSGRRQWCHSAVAGPLEEPSGDRAGRRRGFGRCSGPGTRPPRGQPRQDPDSPTRGTRRWWWDRTWTSSFTGPPQPTPLQPPEGDDCKLVPVLARL